MPEPLPEPPLGSDNQPALVVTVHEQFTCVVSSAVSWLAARHGANVTGSTEYSQSNGVGFSAAWLTENVRPAIVTLPDRDALPLFSLTE